MTENLTIHQKTAIDGEIAYAIYTAPHQEEMLYRLYLLLVKSDVNYREYMIQSMKNLLDEKFAYNIDRIVLQLNLGKVPVWLWINRVKADIRILLISYADKLNSSTSLPIKKVMTKEKIVVSAFSLFIRKAFVTCPIATKELILDLLNEIKEEESLPESEQYYTILKPICFMVLEDLIEVEPTLKEMRCGDLEPNDAILNLSIDFNELLDVNVETEIAKGMEHDNKRNLKKPSRANEKSHADSRSEVIFEGSITHEQLSNFLSNKVMELFGGTAEDLESNSTKGTKQPREKAIRYKVVKRFKDSNISTNLQVFDDLEDAQEFIRDIQERYPEAVENCDLFIVQIKS